MEARGRTFAYNRQFRPTKCRRHLGTMYSSIWSAVRSVPLVWMAGMLVVGVWVRRPPT